MRTRHRDQSLETCDICQSLKVSKSTLRRWLSVDSQTNGNPIRA